MVQSHIKVLQEGSVTLLKGTSVVAPKQCWSGFRAEAISLLPFDAAKDRAARVPLLRLQTQGITRLSGRSGCYQYNAAYLPGNLALMGNGFHLDEVTWHSSDAEAVFIDLDVGTHMLCDEEIANAVEQSVPHMLGFADPTLHALVSAVHAELLRGTSSGRLFGESVSLTICAHIAHHYCLSSKTRAAIVSGALSNQQIRRVTEFVKSHLDQPISLADMAREVGLSRYHFIRSFKRSTGMTPIHYVIKERILAAQKMLMQGKQTIAEIALATGFSSQSHLNNTLVRTGGLTPRQVRIQGRSTPEQKS